MEAGTTPRVLAVTVQEAGRRKSECTEGERLGLNSSSALFLLVQGQNGRKASRGRTPPWWGPWLEIALRDPRTACSEAARRYGVVG
jgi:hypothetical protein